ncbi:hypothetical protein ABZ636_21800 [Streptomyces sp. NPDC007251]|uniref:hypothetical protein n=1 Tax=unclassified Streptomyces TaxID=2593676 RepID=UPI0033C3A463
MLQLGHRTEAAQRARAVPALPHEPEEAAEQLRRALAPASHREAFALLDELFEEHWKIHFLDGYAETHRLAGRPEEALRLHHEALALARRLGNQHAEARAREGIRELSVC